jgi:signal transduction histidine kinase
VLEVSDNGIGIPTAGAGRGNGLGNLRRRLAEVGGTCEIVPGPAGGTLVRLAAPLTLP